MLALNEGRLIKMRTIFEYFLIINVFTFEVTSLQQISSNLQNIEKFTPKNGYMSYGKSNPDVDLNTADMIRKEGYSAEAHVISTEDGYLLTLHRIPGRFKSPTVLLQHGLLGSSADWVLPGSKKGLAYILADHGYDVWLGNFRGNTYSKAHKTLPTSDSRFWNFSWHEMGIYDLPAKISYITNFKQSNLTYIAHSMGTTSFYVMSSMRPDIASRVQIMFSLAPIAYMSHLKSPVRLVAPFAHDYELIAHYLGEDEFFPQNVFIKFLAKYGCDIYTTEHKICANILFAACGYDNYQLNDTLIPLILGHSPAGTSTKTVVHYAQEMMSGKFRQFDYVLYYANNDWLASVTDVLHLSNQLRNVVDLYEIPYAKFNHLDFLWAIQAPELVYSRLLRTLTEGGVSTKTVLQYTQGVKVCKALANMIMGWRKMRKLLTA
ncbi:hypothetical protein KPH14_008608 [Odynerus spinipes]|uniref:Lipase n=1 Tax=Odynerus spinipes TaxID=1348599 RepID=A0AAD9RTS0_9HYME|nr:hypothetical protein KPH14_008608 [Odynerus spinipes]